MPVSVETRRAPGYQLLAGIPFTLLTISQTHEAAFDHPPVSMTTAEDNCLAFAFDGGELPKVNNKRFLKQPGAPSELVEIPLKKRAQTL